MRNFGHKFGDFLSQGGGAGLGTLFGSMGGGQSPYEAQQQYSGQIPGMLSGLYQPYVQMGHRLRGTLEDQFENLRQHHRLGIKNPQIYDQNFSC